MRIKQKQIQLIESTLKEIYKKYKDRGILSIYLWGSILTEDFNSKSSDIDSIAIVDEKSKIKDNEEINNFLKIRFQKIDFKLNYLYLDELNGGKIKSRLAEVIVPNLLLLDFKNWKLIIGKRYSRKDFKLKEINLDEAVQLNLNAIKKDHLPLFKKGDFKVTPYFIKNLMKVCYYLNQIDNSERKIKTRNNIGIQAPLHTNALGKSILAFGNYNLEKIKLNSYTHNTITSIKNLENSLKDVRENGYAIDNNEYQDAMRCVAVPLFNHENILIAAVGISGTKERLTLEKCNEFGKLISDIVSNHTITS